MRNLFIFLGIVAIMLLLSAAFIPVEKTAPAASGRVITDTLQGDTVNFTAMLGMKQMTVTCTQLGGTSDGELILQGSSNGTSFVKITSTSDYIRFYPADTLVVTDGAVWIVDATKANFNYYRVRGFGTTGDTTLVTIDWSKN